MRTETEENCWKFIIAASGPLVRLDEVSGGPHAYIQLSTGQQQVPWLVLPITVKDLVMGPSPGMVVTLPMD